MPCRPAVLLAALALAAAGCGGSDEDDYAKEFKALNAKIVALGREVGGAVGGASQKTNEQIGRQFGGFGDQLGQIQQDLDDLEPPDDLKDEHERLSSAIAEVQDDLGGIERAAMNDDARGAAEAARGLVQDSAALRDSRRTLVRETGAQR